MLIDPHRAYTYFKNSFKLFKSTKGWYAFDNPFDVDGTNKRHMAVNFTYMWVRCWKTEYSSSIADFVMKFEEVSYVEAKKLLNSYAPSDVQLHEMHVSRRVEELTLAELPVSFEYFTEGAQGTAMGDRAYRYLTGERKLSFSQITRANLGYCVDPESEYFGYIIIPMVRRGRLVYYIGRDFIGNKLRYRNPEKDEYGVGKNEVVFNADAVIFHQKIYVVEGAIDAITLADSACSTQGWTLSPEQYSILTEFPGKDYVFVPDAGYYKHALKAASNFLNIANSVKVVNLDPFRDGDNKDVNSLGADLILQLEQSAPVLTYSSILRALQEE